MPNYMEKKQPEANIERHRCQNIKTKNRRRPICNANVVNIFEKHTAGWWDAVLWTVSVAEAKIVFGIVEIADYVWSIAGVAGNAGKRPKDLVGDALDAVKAIDCGPWFLSR